MTVNDLEKTRKEIREIDREMARLFERRMIAVRSVADYKKEHGLPVKDTTREAEMKEQYGNFVADREIAEYYPAFLQNTVDLSCRYQSRLLSGRCVAYCGIEGAYGAEAAKRMYPTAALVSCADFETAYRGVEQGEYDAAVLPLENSFAGAVGQVTDLLFSGSLFVNGMLDLSVRHDLLANPGATLETVKTVMSHPQALEQCAEYIRKNGFETQECSNTAVAAKEVAQSGSVAVAAIASAESAVLFGLEVLAGHINDSANNSTRFIAVSRVRNHLAETQKNGNENFILTFTVQNKAGALAQTLNIIGAHGYNMRTVRSRPMKDLQWQYYFYVEAEGCIDNENGRAMLQELSAVCAGLKCVGGFIAVTGE